MDQQDNPPSEIRSLFSRSAVHPQTFAERTVLQAVATDNDAECFPPDGDATIRTESPRGWLTEQTIRGEFMRWIIFNLLLEKKIPTNRVAVIDARFPDGLDISELTFPAAVLSFKNCRFDKTIDVGESHLLSLELDGSWTPDLAAGAVAVDKDLTMAGFKCPGRTDLSGAKIEGSLIANQCNFGNASSASKTGRDPGPSEPFGKLDAVGMDVRGNALFSSSVMRGVMNLYGVSVGGSLDFGGVQIDGGGSFTLQMEKTTVQGTLILKAIERGNVFSSIGCVQIKNCVIKNGIDAAGGQFRLPQGMIAPTGNMPCGLGHRDFEFAGLQLFHRWLLCRRGLVRVLRVRCGRSSRREDRFARPGSSQGERP